MNKKIYIICVLGSLSFFLLPVSVKAVAVVKGEVPKVEPLQSLPQSIKPNYEHNVQSGEFETKTSPQQQEAAQDLPPVPAPIVKSTNSSFLSYIVIFFILMIPISYILWKKIKKKQ